MKARRIAAFIFFLTAGTALLDRLLFDVALFAIPQSFWMGQFSLGKFSYHFRRAEAAARDDKRPLPGPICQVRAWRSIRTARTH